MIGKNGGYIAYEIFTEYESIGSFILKETVLKAIDEILGEDKTLKINLPSTGVVTLNNQKEKNREVLHMLFATPIKRGKNVEVIEDLLPIYNTEVELKTKPVKNVTLVPQNTYVPYTYENGVLKFTVDKFECSQIAVIEH